jgi:2-polyprenyl-3-methyl-5-hydroxy-6-metoxy-1,4-benzoquinol methylase/catechol 2,3-dioxygenase-like lactoylglutathione lyase family enzyme
MSEEIRERVREKYGQVARTVAAGGGCCGGERDVAACGDPITGGLYEAGETAWLPEGAVRASLGCGNPAALARLAPGETVLDLGSGGGIDVLLSARRVGPAGKVYGLDMTDEMLALARENQRRAGIDNVEFLKGEIERVPLPDESVDVVISNCVINLSADKDRVLGEAFRVLRPGGRFAVSDIVVRGAVPPEIRRSVELWIGCVAGALDEADYRARLARAGFVDVDIEPTRVYRAEDARQFLAAAGFDVERVAAAVDGRFMSAFIRARKPGGPVPAVPRVRVYLRVTDLARSRAFYEAFLGVAPARVRPDSLEFLPSFGPLNLALSEGGAGEARGPVHHLGIQLASREEVTRQLGRVRALGLPVREAMGVECCHAHQDKFWVRDPDGIEWEIHALTHDLDNEPPAPARGLAVVQGGGCCSA